MFDSCSLMQCLLPTARIIAPSPPRYHVTLLGVRGAHDQHMRFNPGLDHVMHEEDTVYYIGFTKEEYSKVGRASHVHTALWEV